MAPAGYSLAFHGGSDGARANAVTGDGLHLFHMQEPNGCRCLSLRRAYFYPFWQIEATNERWHFDVADMKFDPALINMDLARPFHNRWRNNLLGKERERRDGYVFMPLQRRILQHRSFQSMCPIAMIEATLETEKRREIRATLHPNEIYDAADLAILETFLVRYPQFKLVQGDARSLVLGCDYVMRQNSSVVLTGYFAGKPAVLFGHIDFHHIAGSVPRDGLTRAFASVDQSYPFVACLYWFFKLHCINGGAP